MLDKSAPPRTLKLNAADNVVVAVDPVDLGVTVAGVEALKRIPRGHKMAIVPIVLGAGIPLFPAGTSGLKLALKSCAPRSGGALHVIYEAVR